MYVLVLSFNGAANNKATQLLHFALSAAANNKAVLGLELVGGELAFAGVADTPCFLNRRFCFLHHLDGSLKQKKAWDWIGKDK